MSFFCSIDKSTVGTFVYKTARQLLTPICSAESTQYINYHARHASRQQLLGFSVSELLDIDTWFVTALVKATHCREHAAYVNGGHPQPILHKFSRPGIRPQSCQVLYQRRHKHTKAFQALATGPTTKKALLALVDQYDEVSSTEDVPLFDPPSQRQPEPGVRFVVSDKPEDSDWPSEKYTWPAQGEDQKTVELLKKALQKRSNDQEHVYWLYKSLPAPRIPYLSASHRHMLLRTLAVSERKDEHSMLRYLSVVDDMKVCSIALTTSEWNNAMSFAGRYVAKTTETEVESTLRLWKEMEHVAGVQSNSATFNILFDMATKAGKFRLGEMIYQEMENRGLAFNRYHHVSLIHYHGLRGDGDGVRGAYRDLVESGEIVDTVVLNCMVSSLIRAGEPQAAEHVYLRMKMLHSQRMPKRLPSRDYEKRREVTKALVKMGQLAKNDPAARQKFQNKSIIAPDAQTYRILIHYFAIKAGDLSKATALLDEMRWFNVPLQGFIFLSLFKGFAAHGGIRYTAWTADRLESVWRAYMQAIEDNSDDLYIGRWIVIWALRAFAKCSSKARAVQVWVEIKDKWKHTDEELDHVTNILRALTED
ncbi:MAG: hypothetical protein M1818_006752 [Claussenomyces sp. TS43310]|nr:MAG: hypothetical protein M1818_006752 [Claussenomyces sp. TS43310]